MPLLRPLRIAALALAVFALFGCTARSHAQAALLMEEPYGFFGALNPTGHTAVYFSRICAATPIHLRRCLPGEMGSVLARYQGINGYDWVAIPLIPYLYSVEQPGSVPTQVDKEFVDRLRDHYREQHLLSLGEDVARGGLLHGGWTELIGVAYERRVFAIRFNTTEKQDDQLIADLNARDNVSHFQLLFSNCSDFARELLETYFPGKFHRSIFPDAGMTTPKQITYKLVRYGRKHPEAQIAVYEIPQVPGYRRQSHHNKDIAESLITTAYAIPIAVFNPYIAGALVVDYIIRGRYHVIPKDREILGPESLAALTTHTPAQQNASITITPVPDTGVSAALASKASAVPGTVRQGPTDE